MLKDPKRIQVTVTLDKTLLARITERAKAESRTRTNLMALLLAQAMGPAKAHRARRKG